MSNRSLLEFNHDFCPNDTLDSLLELAKGLQLYMRSGDKEALPDGVTFMSMRHHSEASPLLMPDCENCNCQFQNHYRPSTTELPSKCRSCTNCPGYWPKRKNESKEVCSPPIRRK